MCWMNISCPNCGQESTLDDMTRRPVTGWLPPGQFQCPVCGHAFQRREVAPGKIMNGHYFPGNIGIVPCEAVL